MLEDPNHRLGGDVHVRLGVDTTRDRETNELEPGVPMLARFGIAAGRNDTALHPPHPGIDKDGRGQRLGRQLVLREVPQDRCRIQEDHAPTLKTATRHHLWQLIDTPKGEARLDRQRQELK